MNYRISSTLLPELRAALHTDQADKVSHLQDILHSLVLVLHSSTLCDKLSKDKKEVLLQDVYTQHCVGLPLKIKCLMNRLDSASYWLGQLVYYQL